MRSEDSLRLETAVAVAQDAPLPWPPRRGKQLEARLRQFQNGDWLTLLTDSARCAEQSHTHSVRGRRRSQLGEVQRASRHVVGPSW